MGIALYVVPCFKKFANEYIDYVNYVGEKGSSCKKTIETKKKEDKYLLLIKQHVKVL